MVKGDIKKFDGILTYKKEWDVTEFVIRDKVKKAGSDREYINETDLELVFTELNGKPVEITIREL